MKRCVFYSIMSLLLANIELMAQTGSIKGYVTNESGKGLKFASVKVSSIVAGTSTDADGYFELKDLPYDTYNVHVSMIGYEANSVQVLLKNEVPAAVDIVLREKADSLKEIIVRGSLREVERSESPIPVEIISHRLFKKNPTSSLFDAVGMVNGVRPQLNCNICNTGDIHINGMEGPYTMILIDGIPIVSALSSVYGLSGIPNSLIERIEVVKGPASSLYGSEAMGGVINVITKDPRNTPKFSADLFTTGWAEINTDVSLTWSAQDVGTGLLGINYFNYQFPIDKNRDGFTDLTLQDRLSIFNKWNFERKEDRIASIAMRYVYEDRWGGEMNWTKEWRGSNSRYGESIYTSRAEFIGMYQLPIKEKVFTQFSYNWHRQDSYYGTIPYMATQHVTFLQAYWKKELSKEHDFLLGGTFRYTHYDDNTPATTSAAGNSAFKSPLPGLFVQHDWAMNAKNRVLAGYRFDYDKYHGSIHSPRVAYKWSLDSNHVVRASFGTGFRVVNLFTEDHAALTGSREVIIEEELLPEKSYNGNLNYVIKIPTDRLFFALDITGFYSYFRNKIIGDFDTDPNKILYSNLKGHSISQGISLNADLMFDFPLKLMAGLTYMNVYLRDGEEKSSKRTQLLHAPKWSGTFTAGYAFPKNFTVDFTGQWSGAMRLPILPNDYRPEYSPWFCIGNVQVTKKLKKAGLELYGGIKNIFNFVPADPIMRPFDPFDQYIDDPVNNPYGYTFDPSYNYASLQGLRAFFGIRYQLFQ